MLSHDKACSLYKSEYSVSFNCELPQDRGIYKICTVNRKQESTENKLTKRQNKAKRKRRAVGVVL